MCFRGLVGQSAIEYLMTYGWMLLVVAVVGGAVFATVNQESPSSVTGFTGSNVQVDDFGVTSDDDLEMELMSSTGQGATVSAINVTDESNGKYVYKEFSENNSVDVGESLVFDLPNVSQGDSSNNLDVEIFYDTGGLSNLRVSGSLSGNLEIVETSEVVQTQFFTDFSSYQEGIFPSNTEEWTEDVSEGDTGFEISSSTTYSNSDFDGKLLIMNNSGDVSQQLVTWDKISQQGTTEIYSRIFIDNSHWANPIVLRHNDTATGYTGYAFWILGGTGQIIRRHDGDTRTNLVSDTGSSFSDEWVNIRFQADGNDLRAKYWRDSESEPSGWNLTTTDGNYGSGKVGFSADPSELSSLKSDTDKFGVGIDGASAPTASIE